jgi:hypothetical protein
MVCVAHRRHDLALHILLAHSALGAELLLIVGHAVVDVVLCEEAAGRQRLAAFDALKARLVEVFVRHPQHLAATLFLAFRAVDFCLT